MINLLITIIRSCVLAAVMQELSQNDFLNQSSFPDRFSCFFCFYLRRYVYGYINVLFFPSELLIRLDECLDRHYGKDDDPGRGVADARGRAR